MNNDLDRFSGGLVGLLLFVCRPSNLESASTKCCPSTMVLAPKLPPNDMVVAECKDAVLSSPLLLLSSTSSVSKLAGIRTAWRSPLVATGVIGSVIVPVGWEAEGDTAASTSEDSRIPPVCDTDIFLHCSKDTSSIPSRCRLEDTIRYSSFSARSSVANCTTTIPLEFRTFPMVSRTVFDAHRNRRPVVVAMLLLLLLLLDHSIYFVLIKVTTAPFFIIVLLCCLFKTNPW